MFDRWTGVTSVFFPSVVFLLYFLPASLAVYWTFSFSRAAQNVCLLILSLVLYAWGEPLFLIPMLFLIGVNHIFGLMLDGAQFPSYRRKIIAWAVVLNAGVLVLVRYGGWIIDAIADLAGLTVSFHAMPVPVGLPFFTLQALAYVFDVRRGKARPERNIINTGLYIAFLPTVLAGPILRFADVAAQLRERRITMEQFGMGCERFVVGLAKLVVLAAPLSQMAGDIFARSAAGNQFYNTPVLLAWLALVAYSLQIYLGFSGYSDMAIGLARMFGFSIKENFRHPYMAHTVAEFWNRWHISLFRWFYVYVFLVMGGSRSKLVTIRGVTRPRNYVLRNLFVMWLLIGMWHGLSLNHLLFSMWFFVFALFEWLVNLRRKNTGSPLWHLYLLCVVGVGWIFLRCSSLGETLNFFSNLIGVNGNGFHSELALVFIRENWLVLAVGALCCTPIGHRIVEFLRDGEHGGIGGALRTIGYLAVLAGITLVAIVYLTRAGALPFGFC